MLTHNYFIVLLILVLLSLATAVAGFLIDKQALFIGGTCAFCGFVIGFAVFCSRVYRKGPVETVNPLVMFSSVKRNKSDTDLPGSMALV
jgi:hypothetical protein